MATAVYTCSVFKGYPPKNAPTAGDVSVSGTVAWSATSTVGDQAYLAKIPNGAKIVDIIEDHTTGATTQVLKFGLLFGVANGGAGNLSCLITGGAQGTVNRRNVMAAGPNSVWGNNTLTVSLSATTPGGGNGYAALVATVASGTTTTSLFVAFTIIYRTDGPEANPAGPSTF